MESETRVNLIFVIVLLVLTVPGGVILFRKKLDPESRILGMPDPVPVTLAYMVRGPVPPSRVRVAPAKTLAWLRAQLETRLRKDANVLPLGDDSLPLMSEDKRFQVAAATRDDASYSVWVVFWEGSSTQADHRWTLTGNVAGTSPSTQEVSVRKSEALVLSTAVRNELGENGFLVPPKQVLFQQLELGTNPAGSRLNLIEGSKSEEVDKILLAESLFARDK